MVVDWQYLLLDSSQELLLVEARRKHDRPLFEPARLQAFLSYSHDDKKLAGDLKRGLDSLRVDAFLAHEDIDTGSSWPDMILKALKSTDFLVCILTEAFYKSDWTLQEVGVAVGHGKPIVPISVDEVMPRGFMNTIQACKFDLKDWVSMEEDPKQNSSPYEDVLTAVSSNEGLRDRARACLVSGLAYSNTFAYANNGARLLPTFGPYTKVEVNELIRGAITNDNLVQGYVSGPQLIKFYRENKRSVDEELGSIFERLYRVGQS